ncbi:UNVERIFIED_CONTAM: hypothetical protein HDU68_010340 [Siphonaria sp. JEL0065]|nr:hypothetical protein HDU68_010340 [Siphonaria sp. JEL0065]
MRSANSQAAEKVDRKVYRKTVTVWRRETLDNEDGGDSVGLLNSVVPFMIPISEKCPSSVTTDCYSVEYTVNATLFTSTKTMESDSPAPTNSNDTATDETSTHSSTHRLHPLVSESTPLIIQSVRSRDILESLLGRVFVHGESMDGLVDVSAKADREEVVMVNDSEVGSIGDNGVEWRYVDLEVTVKGKLDVDRVESVDAVWKQNTEFRFTALKEDMENRSIIRENGRIEQPRKIGDHAVVHIPVNTKTFVVSHSQPPPPSKPYLRPSTSFSNNRANLRISTCSSDIISMYSSTNDRLQDSSIGTKNNEFQRGIKSAAPPPTSPFRRFSKRKNSLPDVLTPFPLFQGAVGGSEAVGLDLMEEPLGVSGRTITTGNERKFKSFAFLKKLVGGGAGGSATVSDDKPRNTEVIRTRSRIPYGSSHVGAPVGATSTSFAKFMGEPVQQVNQDLKYYKDSSVAGGSKSITVKIRVPLLPKDVASKNALLPGTRLREVTRTHFVVVRVKYHVKKERIHGPLRHDRYVEVVVPLRLVYLKV